MGQSLDLHIWLITICVFLFLLDDLFIDLLCFFKKLKPESIDRKVLTQSEEHKNLAVMIANWQEDSVLEAMVHGNIQNLLYDKLHFFLGVYPNDIATLSIANRMAEAYPNVHVVINSKQGPTYKGQMLNQVIQSIFLFEKNHNIIFDGFILHDSEDILDPYIPYLYSYGLHRADFIQTPVFSLPVEASQWVAGTYMDEFVEGHLKELLVRQGVGAAMPSAGVGTCLSRSLILKFLNEQDGIVFLPDSLTEDYQLGLQTTQWGMKSVFLCKYLAGTDLSKIISTREYFPHRYLHSVRQKTRWTTGIAFQGSRNIGWFGNAWQRYFLWRDRKGPLNAILSLNVIFIFFALLFLNLDIKNTDSFIKSLFLFNTLGMLLRLCVRAYFVHQVYGLKTALLVPFRWPVAVLINMHAGLRAIYQYNSSLATGRKIKWAKTQHRLPEGFGAVASMPPLHNINHETQNSLRDEVRI